MYADPVARGGVLEPEGIVEIKFRVPDLLKAMHRLDPVILALKEEAGPDSEQGIKDREASLLPVYRQVRLLYSYLLRCGVAGDHSCCSRDGLALPIQSLL